MEKNLYSNNQEQMSQNCTIGTKKGTTSMLLYKLITLLSVTYKVISGVIYNRISRKLIRLFQSKLILNSSTIHNNFILKLMQGKEYDNGIYIIYIEI